MNLSAVSLKGMTPSAVRALSYQHLTVTDIQRVPAQDRISLISSQAMPEASAARFVEHRMTVISDAAECLSGAMITDARAAGILNNVSPNRAAGILLCIPEKKAISVLWDNSLLAENLLSIITILNNRRTRVFIGKNEVQDIFGKQQGQSDKSWQDLFVNPHKEVLEFKPSVNEATITGGRMETSKKEQILSIYRDVCKPLALLGIKQISAELSQKIAGRFSSISLPADILSGILCAEKFPENLAAEIIASQNFPEIDAANLCSSEDMSVDKRDEIFLHIMLLKREQKAARIISKMPIRPAIQILTMLLLLGTDEKTAGSVFSVLAHPDIPVDWSAIALGSEINSFEVVCGALLSKGMSDERIAGILSASAMPAQLSKNIISAVVTKKPAEMPIPRLMNILRAIEQIPAVKIFSLFPDAEMVQILNVL